MTKQQILKLMESLNATLTETHTSWVLLTRHTAYKIKKPLKTSFLDYSSLSKRKSMCGKEYLLNVSLSGDMYQGVEEIRCIDNEYHVGSNEGRIVDYAVKMRRLDRKKEMQWLLRRNKARPDDIRRLARRVGTFHINAPAVKFKKFASLKKEFEDLHVLLKSLQPKERDLHADGKLFQRTYDYLDALSAVFKNREREGWIRELHGDLHAGNVFLYKKPVLFDRIEFSKDFRMLDVLHETAFLHMDLEAYKKKDLAAIFLKEYLKCTKFPWGQEQQQVFIYYKAYTANIRAKVHLMAFIQQGRADSQRMYRIYYRLMEKYVKSFHA